MLKMVHKSEIIHIFARRNQISGAHKIKAPRNEMPVLAPEMRATGLLCLEVMLRGRGLLHNTKYIRMHTPYFPMQR